MKTIQYASRLFAAVSLLALSSNAQATTYTWTTGDTTGVWSSTSLTTDWKNATPPNAAGTIVKITGASGGNDAVILDQNATVGEVVNNVNSGGARWNVNYNGVSYFTLTFDGTGMGANIFGNTNIAAIDMSSSTNTSVLNANISLFNTDLDMGSTFSTAGTGNLTIGTLGQTTINNAGSTGDATVAHSLNIRGTEHSGSGTTINSSIGTSGANIALNVFTNTATTTINGVLGTSVSSLTVNSSNGAITILNGANTFTGGTTITAGLLKIGNASALGGSSGAVAVSATGGALDLNGQTVTNTNALTLNGTGISSGGALTNGSGTAASYAGTVAMASDSSIGGSSGSLTLGGVVSGAFNLTKVGTDTLILNNTGNTFGAGKTFTISAGTVQMGAAGALGSATDAVSVTAAAALDLNGQTVTNTNALSINGQLSGTVGALTNSGAAGSYAGVVTLATSASIGGAGDITLGAGLGTDSVTLTKVGADNLILNGASSRTGAVTISAGTIKVGVDGALGTSATSVTVSATGGALDLNGTNYATASALSLTGTGVGTTGALTNSGAAATYGGVVTITGASSIGGTGDITLSSGLGTTALTLTKVGADTLTLSAASSRTGTTAISAGTVKLGNATALGTSAGAVSVASGSALDLNGQTVANTNALTVNGTGLTASPIGALTNSSGTAASYAGTVAMGADSSIGGNSGTLTIGGVVSGTFNLTKVGTDTLILNNTGNTFGTGKTFTINAGTVQLGAAGALGAASDAVSVSATGAALDLNGQTVANTNALTLNGTGISNGGSLINSSGTAASYAGLLKLGSASTITASGGNLALSNTGTITGATFGLTLDGANNGSIASIIGTTTGSLTKNGAGTWTLSGVNTYSGGTTINNGTLAITSQANIASHNVTLNGGTLSWSGAAAATVTSGTSFNVGVSGGTINTSLGTNNDLILGTANQLTGSGALAVTGTGSTGSLLLQAANTYSGAVTVGSGGILEYGIANAIAGAATVTVNTGGQFAIDAAASNNVTLNGGTLLSNNGSLTESGTVSLGASGGTVLLSQWNTPTASSLTLSNVVSGNGNLTVNGASLGGALNLSNVNTYSGNTSLTNGAILNITGSGQLGSGSYAGTIANGGALNYSSSASQTLSGAISGTGSLTVNGTGTVTLSNTPGTSSYSGGTTVNGGGTLLVTNTSGSATGTGGVSVGAASAGTFGGTGAVSGLVTVGANGVITPGVGQAASGTLTVGSLTFSVGSIEKLFVNTGNASGLIAVSTSSGLTLTGGVIDPFNAGTNMLAGIAGTYNVIQYTGSFTGIGGLTTVAAPVGVTYALSNTNTTNGDIQLTVTVAANQWNSAAGGDWNTTGNWSAGTAAGGPNAAGAAVGFASGITVPTTGGTVNLSNNATAGSLTFTSANSYTISATAGKTLTLNNSGVNSTVTLASGDHTISAPVSVSSPGVTATVGTGETLTWSGNISGAGSVTLVGPGNTTLSGANTYSGATVVSSGTVTMTNSLTSAGNISVNSGTLNISGATVSVPQLSVSSGTAAPSFFNLTGNGSVTLSGVLNINTANNVNVGLVTLTSGTLSAGSMAMGRSSLILSGIQTAGTNSQGLYVNGATLNISGNMAIGTSNTSNTSSNNVMVNAGSVTVGGTTSITNFAGGRYSLLDVNGGTFTESNAAGIVLAGTADNFPLDTELLVSGTGILNTPKITLNGNLTTAQGGQSVFMADGGTTYIGTGGIVSVPQTNTTVVVDFGANVATAPIIAASGDWSSSLAIALANSSVGSGSVAPTIQAADSVANGSTAHNITLSGALTGTGGLNKTGGGVLALQNTGNTYSGGTTISAGTVQVSGISNVGGASSTGITFNGGTLQYTASATDPISTDMTHGSAVVTIASGGGTIDTNGNTIEYGNGIGNSGLGGLTLSDSNGTPGSLLLDGVNTYTGATTIASGTLILNNASGTGTDLSASSGVNLTSSAAAFDISPGFDETINDLSGVAGSSVYVGGNNLTAGTSNSTTYAGVIKNGGLGGGSNGSFTKQGSGALTLSGTNLYTGPTQINGGTLSVTGSLAGGAAATLTVGGSGASGTPILNGTGTINGKVVVASASGGAAGTIAPGTASSLYGTLHVGGTISFQTGSDFALNLSGTSAGELIIGGAATIGSGADLTINIGSTPTLSSYTLATAASGLNSSTPFTVLGGLPTGYSLVYTGTALNLVAASYTNGQFTLTTTAASLNVHANGGTTTLSTTIQNTGTGSQDSLNYSSLTATAGSGTVGAASGTTSGTNLAQGVTSSPAASQTYTAGATAGNVTISNSSAVTNVNDTGETPVATHGTTTINVYSGNGIWAATGASGAWGSMATSFGTNWGANQGSPGVTSGFTGVDTATFGVVGGQPVVTVNLNDAMPNVNSITFSSPLTSYTLAQGSGSNSITLSGTTPSINVTGNATAGSQTINAPIFLGANTSVNVGSKQTLTLNGVISDPGESLTYTGPGTTVVTAPNTYTGGTTVSGGKLYVNNTSGSGTGTGSVAVTGGTLAGSGTIKPTGGAGVTISNGATLASGSDQSSYAIANSGNGAVNGTGTGGGLTLDNTEASSSLLTVNGGATLTFALGSTTAYNGGSGALNFANPNTDSTFLNITGSTTDLLFSNTSIADTINLVDLTNGAAPGGVSLTLRSQNPYLLIQTALGNNSDFSNLWTTGGEGQNGFVLGISTGVGSNFTAFNLAAYDINGNLISSSSNLQNLRLYLYNGDLEVVPEPGTWALMLGGLALLIVIKRARRQV